MRLLIQRVKEARVTVDEEVTGQIGPGLLVFLGIHRENDGSEISWLIQKLIHLRVFPDASGKMNRSVEESGGEILVVSQFTLYGNCRNGRRPDYLASASGEQARALYNRFVADLRLAFPRVETGRFAASMDVSLVNDGPVTLIIDR